MLQNKLQWQETKNGVTIYCGLDVRVHTAKSNIIVLLIPGVDGSVDGYKNKYHTIAESIQKKHGAAVVRMENPFITSFHWESNVRHILEFIESNKQEICISDSYEIRIMAHSAGASVIASIAHEHQQTTRLLLVNPAMSLNSTAITEGLDKFGGSATILIGSKDTNYSEILKLESRNKLKIITVENADHNFSGDSFQAFLDAANKYLFGGEK